MAPKLSCSELKKLQVKRRRLMTTQPTTGAKVPSLPKLTSVAGPSDTAEKENPQPVNPFAKKQSANLCINDLSSISLSSTLNLPSYSAADFFEEDVFDEFEQQKSSIVEDELKEAVSDNTRSIIVEKSLKTNVIIESPGDLSFWQRELGSPEAVQRIMRNWGDNNIQLYYRYPDSSLPPHQKKLIHKALNYAAGKSASSKPDETLQWYRQFSENWRKALLSAFEAIKLDTISCFYFIQEGMTVLFDRTPTGLKAFMKLSSLALAEDFKTNGIEYKFLVNDDYKLPEENDTQSHIDEESDQSQDSDDAEEASQQLPAQTAPTAANIRFKRAPVKFEKKDIYLEGVLSLAELVDYLINQKDRNSFAILPEIYAPGPFIYGTLRRNEITCTGACRTVQGSSVYQLRLQGIIFPRNLNNFLRLLGPERISQLTQERQALTDFLSVYQQPDQ